MTDMLNTIEPLLSILVAFTAVIIYLIISNKK